MHALLVKFFTRYPRKSIRLLEVIPPLISLFLISLPFWGAIYFPVLLSYFIIFFNMYWLYKSLNLAACSFISGRKIKEAERIDWLARAQILSNFSKIKHVIIIPTYQESIAKIKETIESVNAQTFPAKNILALTLLRKEKKTRKKSQKFYLRNSKIPL